MPNDMLKITLTGRLAAKPELHYTSGGQSVTNLTVYSNQQFTNKNTGETVKRAHRSRVVVWGKQAENCVKFLNTGRRVLIEGQPQTRKWIDKDGVTRYTDEIKATNVTFLDSPKGTSEVTENVPSDEAPLPDDSSVEHMDAPAEDIPDHRNISF